MPDEYDSPWLDSDVEYEQARHAHPSRWGGPPRYTVHCPACGRGLNSAEFLVPPLNNPDGPKTCESCRRWYDRLNHMEELRRK